MNARSVVFFTAIGLVAVAHGASAQQFVPAGRDTLRGLPGVEVLVEPVPSALTQSGLTAAGISAEVVKQLASGGITVYPSQMQNPSPAKAYLYLQVGGTIMPREGYILGIQVQVRQTLRSPVTSSNIVNAMTWDQGTVLLAPLIGAAPFVSREIQGLVDQFIRDWRAVH